MDGIVFLHDGSQGNRMRATMKAINAAPHRPSTTLAPTECDELFLSLMPMRADQSAVGTINRVHDQSAPTVDLFALPPNRYVLKLLGSKLRLEEI